MVIRIATGQKENKLLKEQALLAKRVRMMLMAFVLVAALLIGSLPVEAQGGGPALFVDAGTARPSIGSKDASHVTRSRYVNVNMDLLFDANRRARDAKSTPEITLNLFEDAAFAGVVKSVKGDRWGTTWYGRLKNHTGGYFYLTVVEDAFIAHVASPRGVYEVSFARKGLYKVIEIDQSQFVDEPENVQYDPPGEILPMDSLGNRSDSAGRIDIMVVYTAAARAAEGSTAAMKARIKLAVDETNTSYANAGVTPRLRLVHVEEVSYTETGDIGTDLDLLRLTWDGYMDNVHSLRNIYGADMVSLIVEKGGGYCGIAAAIMASASNAFQVTVRDCATGYYTFGHEFGHLQGARHDAYVDPNNWPYDYGHGYVHPYTADASKRWRTIMADNNRCSEWGYNCTRLQYWSNPNKTYIGDSMGDSQSGNYQVLNNTAYTVANFRKQKIGNDFNSSFNSSSSGWAAVNGTWRLYKSAYYRSTGEANLFASAKRNAWYGDLTYEVRMKRSGACATCPNHISVRGVASPLDDIKRWNREYKFAYANSGVFSVLKVDGSTETALKSWAASSAIVQNGWNTLKVVAVGQLLNFYINDTLVWSGIDPDVKTGQVGFGFYRDADAGELIVNWAKLYTTPLVDLNPVEAVSPGVEVPGGNDKQSP